MANIFGDRKFTNIYRSEDFSISKEVESDDPWEVPDTIKEGDVVLTRIPNSAGPGWTFRRFYDDDGNELVENCKTDSDIREFTRNGKVWKRQGAEVPQFLKHGESTAKGYGKLSDEFTDKMKKIKKRLPKRMRKQETIGNGLFNF